MNKDEQQQVALVHRAAAIVTEVVLNRIGLEESMAIAALTESIAQIASACNDYDDMKRDVLVNLEGMMDKLRELRLSAAQGAAPERPKRDVN